MALDSQQKRMAVTGVGRPWMRSVYPNILKDNTWRASVGNVYPVADFTEDVVPEVTGVDDVYLVVQENPVYIEASNDILSYVEINTNNTIVVKEEICVIVEVRDT